MCRDDAGQGFARGDRKTIGDAVGKRRLDLGLRQADAARLSGVDVMSVNHWETGRHQPRAHLWGRIREFLGQDLPGAGTRLDGDCPGEEALARLISVWPDEVSDWETGRHRAGRQVRLRLVEAIGIDPWVAIERVRQAPSSLSPMRARIAIPPIPN